jgi:hypothetical protein
MRIPEGREPGTHSEDLNFKKVGREPNRFEMVFYFVTSRTHLKAMRDPSEAGFGPLMHW